MSRGLRRPSPALVDRLRRAVRRARRHRLRGERRSTARRSRSKSLPGNRLKLGSVPGQPAASRARSRQPAAPGSITGAEIDERRLGQVPSAAHADSADTPDRVDAQTALNAGQRRRRADVNGHGAGCLPRHAAVRRRLLAELGERSGGDAPGRGGRLRGPGRRAAGGAGAGGVRAAAGGDAGAREMSGRGDLDSLLRPKRLRRRHGLRQRRNSILRPLDRHQALPLRDPARQLSDAPGGRSILGARCRGARTRPIRALAARPRDAARPPRGARSPVRRRRRAAPPPPRPRRPGASPSAPKPRGSNAYWTPARMRAARPLDSSAAAAAPTPPRRRAPASPAPATSTVEPPRSRPTPSTAGIFVRQGGAARLLLGDRDRQRRPGGSSSPPATASTAARADGAAAAPGRATSSSSPPTPTAPPPSAPSSPAATRSSRPKQWIKHGNPDFDIGAFLTEPERRRRQRRRRGRRRRHDRHSTTAASSASRPSAIPARRDRMRSCGSALRRRRHAHLPPSPARRRSAIRCHWAARRQRRRLADRRRHRDQRPHQLPPAPTTSSHTFGPYFTAAQRRPPGRAASEAGAWLRLRRRAGRGRSGSRRAPGAGWRPAPGGGGRARSRRSC